MSGIESENANNDQQGSDHQSSDQHDGDLSHDDGSEARRRKHGSMRDAQDDAERAVGAERQRNAAAGDPQAQAEGSAERNDDGTGGTSGDCPLCGLSMTEHSFDRSHANAVLNCPVPPNPQKQSSAPLNELGMIKPAPDGSA